MLSSSRDEFSLSLRYVLSIILSSALPASGTQSLSPSLMGIFIVRATHSDVSSVFIWTSPSIRLVLRNSRLAEKQ